jgi:hypothetical protein
VRTRPSPRRAVIALLASCLLLAGCGGDPAAVTLEQLVEDTAGFDGEDVVVAGTVVEFDESTGAIERHLVLEDAADNRVRLLPIDVAEPFIGADAEVSGRFVFDPDRGRTIQVESIREARAAQ